MKQALILLAGGKGKRFKNSQNLPKQYIKFGSYNLIEYFLNNLDQKTFKIIVIVCNLKHRKKYLKHLKKDYKQHNIHFVESGKNRQDSSRKGVFYLKKFNPRNVLIHDSARPLASNSLIKKLIKHLSKNKACSPYIKHNDLVKYMKSELQINNDIAINIQTPQAFRFKTIYNAHKNTNLINSKDDTNISYEYGIKTKYIKGEKLNFKITVLEDIKLFLNYRKKTTKYGIGYDIHKINFNSKKYLKLCGVKINHPPLIGHSDADVGYHAICDSILGSLSMRDIGYYFNNKNIKWKNINSNVFMKFCSEQLINKNYKIINLDINFICETPKINKYITKMKNNISKLLKVNLKNISIKATTNEKIGFIGSGLGIAAESIVQIQNE